MASLQSADGVAAAVAGEIGEKLARQRKIKIPSFLQLEFLQSPQHQKRKFPLLVLLIRARFPVSPWKLPLNPLERA